MTLTLRRYLGSQPAKASTTCAEVTLETNIQSDEIGWFFNGQDIFPGPGISFDLEYVNGCFQYGGAGHDWLIGSDSFKVVDENGAVIGNAPGDWNSYKDYNTCAHSGRSFNKLRINKYGGKIGLKFTDSDYRDNVIGLTNNPMYKLIPVKGY